MRAIRRLRQISGMGVRPFAFFCCVALLPSAAGAQAMYPPARRTPPPPAEIVIYRDATCPVGGDREVFVCSRRPITPEGVRRLDGFARCLARRQPRPARALLAMVPAGDDYRRAMRSLADANRGCAPAGRLGFSPLLLAGGLAEALLGDGTQTAAPDRLRLDPRRPIRARDEADAMSLCVIGAAPAEVAALFASAPASSAEARALRAIAPRLDACLAAGLSARLDHRVLRALLALSAYRLSMHNARRSGASAY